MTKKMPGRPLTSAEPGDVSSDCNVAKRKTEPAIAQATLPLDQILVGQHRAAP
jgi:hypothetical protein